MADSTIRVRRVAAADSPFILTWRNDPSAYRWFRDARPLTEEEHTAWTAARVAEDPPSVWIADVDDEPVGCVRLDTEPDGSAEVSIVVDASRRGLGVGADLLDHCVREAADRGIHTLRAEVDAGNAASLGLFTSRHFRETGSDERFVQLLLSLR